MVDNLVGPVVAAMEQMLAQLDVPQPAAVVDAVSGVLSMLGVAAVGRVLDSVLTLVPRDASPDAGGAVPAGDGPSAGAAPQLPPVPAVVPSVSGPTGPAPIVTQPADVVATTTVPSAPAPPPAISVPVISVQPVTVPIVDATVALPTISVPR